MKSHPVQPNPMLKYVSLVTLTLQNAILGLSMRYARTRPGDMFLSSSAVLMSEFTKLITCLAIVWKEEGSFNRAVSAVHNTVIRQPVDTLKVCVPSLLYIIQNNLLYVSASHLDAATYQVTYQLKILTTAMFAVTMMRRKLLSTQWISLVTLVCGVILVQLANTDPPKVASDASKVITDSSKIAPGAHEQNRVIGFSAALCACLISGFAGIYFEKILKGSDISVWMRNVQLSSLSLPLGLCACFLSDYETVMTKGLFFGYDGFIWYLVVLQAGGGLLVAMVVKYADNILKGFATSLAIIVSCIASIYIFDFNLTFQFSIGAGLVIMSIFLYSYVPPNPNQQSKV